MIGGWLRALLRPTAPPGIPLRLEPPGIPLRLEPANDLAAVDGALHSTGSDPYALLLPPDGTPFPAGRCEFAFTAGPSTVPLQPVLYLDTGGGFTEAQSVRLAGGGAGRHRHLLDLPPGLQRLRFDPTALSGPLPLSDAVLEPRNGPSGPCGDSYREWLDRFGTIQPDDGAEMAAHAATLRTRIHVRIHGGDPAARARTEAGLAGQIYRKWTLDPPHADNEGEAALLLLQAGDVLPPDALYRFAAAPPVPVLTADEDRLDPETGCRSDPVFRGQPSPVTLDGGEAPGAVLLRGPAAARAGALPKAGWAEVAALVRDATAGTAHLPGLLVHATTDRPVLPPAPRPALPQPAPTTSVVIASRDKAELLRRTLDGVLHRTEGGPDEIIIMDNGSTEPATAALYAGLAAEQRVRIIPAPGPFNYAALNNAGVAAASGDIVVLLNNDMDVIGPGWLRALAAWAVQPGVGAVGAKLLYGDGTVQHAGIVTGMHGLAGHAYRHRRADDPVAGGALHRVREVSAVTGACLALRRTVFQEIGGLDAEAFAVSYNDVDLCLRLRRAGLRIVWTPDATLHHLESASRGLDARPDNAARAQAEHDALLRRWGAGLLADPFYNANLDLGGETCGLAWPPRTPRPWRERRG